MVKLETPFNYFLTDIINYYTGLLEGYINTTEGNILELISESAQEGKKFSKDLSYSSQSLNILNEDWAKLPEDVLTHRLRNFLILSNFQALGTNYIVNINGKKIANFSYKDGLIKEL